jgi:hypothetical protein
LLHKEIQIQGSYLVVEVVVEVAGEEKGLPEGVQTGNLIKYNI